jgi:hypothetical protein
MKRRVGPFWIVERRNQFEVRRSGNCTVLSKHNNFLNAEEAALRMWLGPRDDEDFNYELQSNIFERATDRSY